MGSGPKYPDKMSGRWLRSSLRILTLTTLFLGLLIMALEFGTIVEKEKKIATEKGAAWLSKLQPTMVSLKFPITD